MGALIVSPADVGARGFDTDRSLDAPTIERMSAVRSLEFGFVYLGSGYEAAQARAMMDAGLAVMAVTFSRDPGWQPSAAVGAQDAQAALGHLAAGGFAKGVSVFLDLEEPGGIAADVEAWANAWSQGVRAGGYDACLYVGAGALLTGPELYALPHIDRYWHSLSSVRDRTGAVAEPNCGWCVEQVYSTQIVAGVAIDYDFIKSDFRGRVPFWMRRSP